MTRAARLTGIVEAVAALLITTAAVCSQAHARDGFEKVRCNGDVARALIGQRGSNEPVVAIEGRHKDLKLKDVGASDYGRFSSITWLICGREFVVLEHNRTNLIHDVLPIPPRSTTTPAFEGTCKINGKAMREVVIAILRDEGGGDALPAEAAWRIDEKKIRFVRMNPEGLLCPRDGIWKPSA